MEKTIKIATLGIADEFRKMAVGETIEFPLDKYNYNSVRSTPATTLVKERLEGKAWKTRINLNGRCVEVTRTA